MKLKLLTIVPGLLMCTVSMATLGVANAAPVASPVATANSSHLDPTAFDIPVLPQPRNGFGEALEAACDVLRRLNIRNSSGNAIQPRSPVRNEIARTLSRVPDVNSPVDVDAVAEVVSQLKQICHRIDQSELGDSDVDALLAFESSGSFPSLVAALQASERADVEKASAAVAEASDVHAVDGKDIARNMLVRENSGAGPDSAPTLAGFESNLLNGLADFLVTRSKEEAILYLQEEFRSKMCQAGKHNLLDNTCRTIQDLDAGMSVAAIGNALNAAAKRDLVQLPNGLLLKAAEAHRENYQVFEVGRLLYAIALAAEGGRLPQDAARSLYALPLRACETTPDDKLSGADRQCRTMFMTVRFASALLYSVESNGIPQIYDRLGTHRSRAVGTVVEAAFRYNQQISTGASFPLTANLLNKLGSWLVILGEVEKQWSQRQSALTSTSNGVNVTDRKRLLSGTLVDTIVRFSNLMGKIAPELTVDEQARQHILGCAGVARGAAAIGRDIITEDYGSIPLHAQDMISTLAVFEKSKDLAHLLDDVRKYLAVIVEISSAKSSADVAAAFSAAAAPAESYRAKYQRTLLSVGALVGGIVGKELPNDPTNTALGRAKSSGMVAGFAPLGVEMTVPISPSFYGGLMLSVIDIGALTTARFKQEVSSQQNVSTTSDVTFKQVFSPGLFGLIGIFKLPVAIGGGASLAPELRTLQTTDMASGTTTKEAVSSLRFGGFVAMDVSILSL